ncbi:MAG: hypothetical protein QOH88_1143 [Verrucomicrobiota bacterium]|jgi:hypothetical protein
MSNKVWTLLLAIGLLAMAGCGGPSREIVGKWRTAGEDGMVWEFLGNGSMQMGDRRGRYSFGDQTRLKIEMPGATFVYGVELAGDHMTLKEPRGAKLEFTRMK